MKAASGGGGDDEIVSDGDLTLLVATDLVQHPQLSSLQILQFQNILPILHIGLAVHYESVSEGSDLLALLSPQEGGPSGLSLSPPEAEPPLQAGPDLPPDELVPPGAELPAGVEALPV